MPIPQAAHYMNCPLHELAITGGLHYFTPDLHIHGNVRDGGGEAGHPRHHLLRPLVDVVALLGDDVDDVGGVLAEVRQLVDDVGEHGDVHPGQGVVLTLGPALGKQHRQHLALGEGHFDKLARISYQLVAAILTEAWQL